MAPSSSSTAHDPWQVGDSMDYDLSTMEPTQSEASYQERDAQSTNTGDPFLSSNGHSTVSNLHKSQINSSGHLYSLWAWEIISILFSIICMGAIVGVLFTYHSKAVPTLPSGLTLNALISLLATISKAAMLVSVTSCLSQLKWQWFRHPQKLVHFNTLDEASRGPWGSFGLLLKIRRPSLVGLGALVVILAVGIDPFMQQVISYPTTSIEASGSFVARAQAYDSGLSLRTFEGGLMPGPEFGMKAAIYNGIFNASSSTESILSCSTGNCTFPIFDSLAFCSRCRNVTDTTILRSHNSGTSPIGSYGSTMINYTYSLPGDYMMMFTAYFEDGEQTDGSSSRLVHGPSMISNFGMPESMSRSQLGVPNPISSLALMQFPNVEKSGSSGDYLAQTPLAWQCALYFCLQTYNVSVLNGVPTADVVSSWNSDLGTPLPIIASFPFDYYDTNNTVFERPKDSLVNGGNGSFFIPGGTIAAMASYLNHTMSGSMLEQGAETDDSDGWVNDVMQALNSTVNIDGMMTGLASSITTFIRQSNNRGSIQDATVTGVALKIESYVLVRWAWIALPMSLLLLSTVLLLTTTIRASKEQTPVWKSSSLATLFHGLTDNDIDVAQSSSRGIMSIGSITDMNYVATITKARLRKGENDEWNLTVLKQLESD